MEERDLRFMRLALEEAAKAAEIGEVPIGAVIVRNDVVVGTGFNRRESDRDPTAHAEMIAIREASRYLGGWRLTDCEMYVTIEPCPMCSGALVLARVERLVFGARDPKGGAVRSLYGLLEDARLNHRMDVVEGVLQEECSSIMREFFRKLRKRDESY